ncbi:MAG: FTR1 family protein [Alphaproteobacteria bacterium]
MLATAIIIFRETLEIAMILGVVLAATKGLAGRTGWVLGGLLGGLLGAGVVAGFARAIAGAMAGAGQEFFNAGILFTAATVIGWTAIWLRKNAKHMVMHLHQVGHDARDGKLPLYSLAVIVGLALLREGSEIVLFIYGMAMTGQSNGSIVSGSALGFALGLVVGLALYYGLLKMPARQMLKVTGWMLILLVAGLASQAVEFLSAAGYFTGMSAQMWDTSWLLSQGSILGKALHSLIGYTARPSLIQVVTYFGALALMLLIIRIVEREKSHALA